MTAKERRDIHGRLSDLYEPPSRDDVSARIRSFLFWALAVTAAVVVAATTNVPVALRMIAPLVVVPVAGYVMWRQSN